MTTGMRLSLPRTRSAAAAASSATAISVASSSRPCASCARASRRSAAARRSRSPPRPGPSRHARPKLSAITTATVGGAGMGLPGQSRLCVRGDPSPAPRHRFAVVRRDPPPTLHQRSRADAPSRRIGILGQQADRVVLGHVGAVDAGVGADEAVVRLCDQDAALGPQHLAALLEDQLDQRRLLAEDSGELARFGAGDDRGEPAQSALRLGDDLLGRSRRCRRLELSALGNQLAEVRALPRSPAARTDTDR